VLKVRTCMKKEGKRRSAAPRDILCVKEKQRRKRNYEEYDEETEISRRSPKCPTVNSRNGERRRKGHEMSAEAPVAEDRRTEGGPLSDLNEEGK